MKYRLIIGFSLLIGLLNFTAAFSATETSTMSQASSATNAGFKITDIKLEGLQRISKGTVYNYLPVKVGQTITESDTNGIITALYKTGFFSNVSVSHKGGELIIKVAENPVIGNILLSGNDAIQTENLMDALKKMEISEGLTYNNAVVERAKIALEEQYYNMGYYGAKVDVVETQSPRNRITLSITISEGSLAIVKDINIIGNKQVSDKVLKENLQLSTTLWYSWITHNDRYSKEKMNADVQTISSYYLDHGYLDFAIDSTTVQVTPDKSSVYITIDVTEGEKYKVSGFDVSGTSVIPFEKLTKAVTFNEGDAFSRQQVINTETKFKDMLGSKGYAFTQVKVRPEIDKEHHTVFIHFDVQQGELVYVRHIAFIGNNKTNDSTLRNKLAQVEGGLIDTDKLKQTKRQLNQLPYVRNASIATDKVPGSNDQVDINVKMEEVPSAQVSAGIGYSEVDGVLLNATLVQKDVLGTGKSLQTTVVNSDYRQTYSIGYTNPFYTSNGISRGFTVYLDSYDPSAANISSDYSYNEYGGRMNYTIPMSATIGATNSLSLGYGFAGTSLDVTDDASIQVQDFEDEYGDRFNEVLLTAGWIHNGLNRYVFPTRGVHQTTGVNLYLPGDSDALSYYKLNYNADVYVPFTERYILKLRGQLGYGDGYMGTESIPFYNNYYAGGMSTVRGYEANTLGPLDSNGDPFGGNYLMDVTIALIFPNFISPDNLRTSIFVDGGNVYDLEDLTADGGFSASDLRYSVGIDMKWLSPLGLLEFTLAHAINESSSDKTQVFDFMIGASF